MPSKLKRRHEHPWQEYIPCIRSQGHAIREFGFRPKLYLTDVLSHTLHTNAGCRPSCRSFIKCLYSSLFLWLLLSLLPQPTNGVVVPSISLHSLPLNLNSRLIACTRLITDRFALPPDADTNACDPRAQTWCGGTWNSITNNLDYIQVNHVQLAI